jgi:dsRNA-specific ribonuclease
LCRSAATYAPAELSWRRAALVNNAHLGRAAAAAGLQQHLQARSTQLDRVVRRFVQAQAAAAAAGSDDVAALGPTTSEQQQQQQQDAALQTFLQEASPRMHWSSSCVDIWRDVWTRRRKSTPLAAAGAGHSKGNGVGVSSDGGLQDAALSNAAEQDAGAAATRAVTSARKKPAKAPKVVADLVESIIGAVLVDSAAGGATDAALAWQRVWHTVQRLLQLPGVRDQQHTGGS